MENEDGSVKTEDIGEPQEKNHGFATHSPGTWNQDELTSSAEKDSNAHLPPKKSNTEGKA
jgi:hypothetical protein